MTLRVATVLSARDWEARLVAAARSTASVRLVLRAFLPDEVLDSSESLDVVVVGAETPWASPARLRTWSRAGMRVVAVHPPGDRPAADRLGGADLTLPDDLPAETMLREIRLLEPAAARPEAAHPCTVVTGPRGAPGRTETALAIAWLFSGREAVTLVDADLDSPALAVRLGLPPGPDLADAVDSVHDNGSVPDGLLHTVGRLAILTGAHHLDEPPLRAEPVFDVVDALRLRGRVVVDCGPWPDCLETIKAATDAVVVLDASPAGIVRGAAIFREWAGPPPTLVVNRVSRSDRSSVDAATRWTGVQPAAVIRVSNRILAASRAGTRPSRRILKPLLEVAG